MTRGDVATNPLQVGEKITVRWAGQMLRVESTGGNKAIATYRVPQSTGLRIVIMSQEGVWWMRGWGDEIEAAMRAVAAL